MNLIEIIGAMSSAISIFAGIFAAIKFHNQHYRFRVFILPSVRPDKPVVIKRLSWLDIDNALDRLEIDAKSFSPELVIMLNRGGAIIGGMLSKRLGINEISQISINLDDPSRKYLSSLSPLILKGKKILIIDDIARSGRHLNIAKDSILSFAPDAIVRRVVLLDIRDLDRGLETNNQKNKKLDFYSYFTYDTRVLLPWDQHPIEQ